MSLNPTSGRELLKRSGAAQSQTVLSYRIRSYHPAGLEPPRRGDPGEGTLASCWKGQGLESEPLPPVCGRVLFWMAAPPPLWSPASPHRCWQRRMTLHRHLIQSRVEAVWLCCGRCYEVPVAFCFGRSPGLLCCGLFPLLCRTCFLAQGLCSFETQSTGEYGTEEALLNFSRLFSSG